MAKNYKKSTQINAENGITKYFEKVRTLPKVLTEEPKIASNDSTQFYEQCLQNQFEELCDDDLQCNGTSTNDLSDDEDQHNENVEHDVQFTAIEDKNAYLWKEDVIIPVV